MSRTKARGNVLDAITPPLSGAVMSDEIDMTLSNIVNLLNPIDDQDAATRKYVDDQIVTLVTPIINSLVPAGVIIAWGNAAPPTDWVVCDGTSYLTATYPTLSAAIGTTYGVGVNDFQVPDLRGRSILGQYTAGTPTNRVTSVAAQVMGSVDGSGSVSIGSPQLPNHNHTASAVSDGSHSHSGTTGNGGNHNHDITTAKNFNLDGDGSPNQAAHVIKTSQSWLSGLVDTIPNHNHTLSMNGKSNHTHTLNIANQGVLNPPHENAAPFQTVNYIIKVV